MTRLILCEMCGKNHQPDPLDTEAGFQYRKVAIPAIKKPKDHSLTVNGTRYEISKIICDFCSSTIEEGSSGYGVTMWRVQGTPENWEQEYGYTFKPIT